MGEVLEARLHRSGSGRTAPSDRSPRVATSPTLARLFQERTPGGFDQEGEAAADRRCGESEAEVLAEAGARWGEAMAVLFPEGRGVATV